MKKVMAKDNIEQESTKSDSTKKDAKKKKKKKKKTKHEENLKILWKAKEKLHNTHEKQNH